MNSLRSPLHIPFTYQFVCAPVGAHSLPFTCFASHHSLLPHSQLFHPPKPLLRCSLHSQYFLLGVCRCLLFLLACGSLRADRAVMFFAFPHVLSVASFQSFVPHSFNSATFSTAHKSRSFTSLHEPTHRHSAICLQTSYNGFVLQSKITNPTNAIAGSYCSIPFQQSFRSAQSL